MSEIPKPYSNSIGSDGKHYVKGPSQGELGYDSGTLWPTLRFPDEVEAARAAKVANIAYEQGYMRAQAVIQEAMGLTRGR